MACRVQGRWLVIIDHIVVDGGRPVDRACFFYQNRFWKWTYYLCLMDGEPCIWSSKKKVFIQLLGQELRKTTQMGRLGDLCLILTGPSPDSCHLNVPVRVTISRRPVSKSWCNKADSICLFLMIRQQTLLKLGLWTKTSQTLYDAVRQLEYRF